MSGAAAGAGGGDCRAEGGAEQHAGEGLGAGPTRWAGPRGCCSLSSLFFASHFPVFSSLLPPPGRSPLDPLFLSCPLPISITVLYSCATPLFLPLPLFSFF